VHNIPFDEDIKMPLKWMAPECINFRHYSLKSDVWMYGVCCWEIMSYGTKPYPTIRNADVVEHIEAGGRLPQPHGCPDAFYRLLMRCWAYDSKDRPAFDEISSQLLGIIADAPPTSPAAVNHLRNLLNQQEQLKQTQALQQQQQQKDQQAQISSQETLSHFNGEPSIESAPRIVKINTIEIDSL
jgi:serine/threonine protein kinase